MACKAVLFDLDGTLLDTLDEIAAAANKALADRGYPTHGREAYRRFVGDGSLALMERVLPESARSQEMLQACLTDYIENYRNGGSRATAPYPGIPELLTVLARDDIGLAVVSNKPDVLTRISMDTFFNGFSFKAVLGLRNGVPKKPDPAAALEAAAMLGADTSGCWFLGDSPMDMECAQRAGMVPVGVRWGFRPERELLAAGARVMLTHPLALLTVPGFADG